jgi:DNA-binding PadR family transcriptional regulator
MLELAVLGLLKERAMHGYELRKQLSQKLGFFWTVSFGSLYPTLRRLEKRGAVRKTYSADQASRRKQVYAITEAGEREFLEMLEEGTAAIMEEDKFPLRLAFFGYLRPESRIKLLERRKTYLQEKLDEGRKSLKRASRGRADSYTLSLMRHGCDTTEHDIAWLEELIAAERSQLDPAQPPPVPEPDPSSDEPTELQTN